MLELQEELLVVRNMLDPPEEVDRARFLGPLLLPPPPPPLLLPLEEALPFMVEYEILV